MEWPDVEAGGRTCDNLMNDWCQSVVGDTGKHLGFVHVGAARDLFLGFAVSFTHSPFPEHLLRARSTAKLREPGKGGMVPVLREWAAGEGDRGVNRS